MSPSGQHECLLTSACPLDLAGSEIFAVKLVSVPGCSMVSY
jgi:hypothetical protein